MGGDLWLAKSVGDQNCAATFKISMTSTKYIGMDVHKESSSIAVLNFAGRAVMECVIETTASTILQFINGLR